ncbi:unnamed protein product [Effrenium voratum]|nr:unnamed protein product [Effrenium voratum]
MVSLDPLLREEVLLSAPEELLRTLPAELVAEAQLLRDRAFTRIAMRRDIPPAGRISMPGQTNQEPAPQSSQAPRQHAHLLMIEQQLLHHNGNVRRWSGPIGLQRRPPGGGLSSFDESDQLLLRLADFDDTTAEVPLSPSVIPQLCRLMYLRAEVSTIPLTRLCFNLSLHPVTRNALLGHFLILLCKQSEADAPLDALPPPCLFEAEAQARSPLEVQSVGSQRVLAILAYLLRRVPQCGEFFAQKLASEPWMSSFQVKPTSDGKKSKTDHRLLGSLGISMSELPGKCSINLLMQLVNTRLYLSSSRHAAWLLSLLHALLVQPDGAKEMKDSSMDDEIPDALVVSAQNATAPAAAGATNPPESSKKHESPAAERWSKITQEMHKVHGLLSKESVLALCHFLCHAGSGHGSSSEGDAFQLTGDILVAFAVSRTHLATVRTELLRVLGTLVQDIEQGLAELEAAGVEASTVESRFLRVVRTLTEVFREASKSGETSSSAASMEEARVEMLWDALDRTLERLDDPEPAPKPEAAAPEANGSPSPPKPLLNRLLPLIEAFFVLHGKEERDASDPTEAKHQHVFEEHHEQSAAERSRFGQFCKKHRRSLNALLKQTPSLLSKSFLPMLQLMPSCLDFDNKRAHFRGQLRSRRLESRYQTIRLRVRRNEIFMDSYHQLRIRTGEEMRAKIQVQFQGEEGIDAGGVAKEWYGALAKEIFNPNYALFVQAGGKACTYHPNPMSYVNRDHLQFFHFIGRVVGKAIHDGQNLEAWFTRGFYKHMLGKKVIPADLEAFDPEYFSNLKWMLDHDISGIIELTFSAESDELGQMKVVDLKPNGRNLPVTNDNKHEYIQLMSEHKMTNSVKQQIEHFLRGLHEIVPPQLLSLFDDKELELLISGLPDIDIEDLKQNTEYHNYTPQSDQVQWFWKVLSEFTQDAGDESEQRAWFLQFATGTSRVPVEGFKGLVGMRGPQKFSLHRAYGLGLSSPARDSAIRFRIPPQLAPRRKNKTPPEKEKHEPRAQNPLVDEG